MENQIPENNILPKYIMPLIVTSVLLSLVAVVLSVFSLARPIDQVQQIDSLQVVEVSDFETKENIVTYRSVSGDFTFSIPQSAVVRQTDSGGKSAISIYKDEDSLWQSEGLIYSILFVASSEFETGESYSFEDWLDREDVTLTGHSVVFGGWEFHEGHKEGDIKTLSHYHYVDEIDDQRAYVVAVPAIRSGDEKGVYIQGSLNFNPTNEELNDAQLIQ